MTKDLTTSLTFRPTRNPKPWSLFRCVDVCKFRAITAIARLDSVTTMSNNILVTGVTGFIGSEIALKFRTEGWNVRGVDVIATGPRFDLLQSKGIEVLAGSTIDDAFMLGACRGMDAVVHCAALMDDALPWDTIMEANVKGRSESDVAT